MRDQIPLCDEVELGFTSMHDGVRVWVRMKYGWHEPDAQSRWDTWIRWPNGLSLGAGPTARAALRSAEDNLPDLVAYIENGMKTPTSSLSGEDAENQG